MNVKSDINALQMTVKSLGDHRRLIGRHCEKATQILFYQIAARSEGRGETYVTDQELDDLSTAVNGIMSILNWKEGE
jgi:trehalose-6-phosphate synthase